MKPRFRSLPYKEMRRVLGELGEPEYKLNALLTHVFRNGVDDFEEIRQLKTTTREALAQTWSLELPVVSDRRTAEDGTVKYLIDFDDRAKSEAVLMPSIAGKTLCVSSQAGCRLKCTFCATGSLGLTRNLSFGEILDQFLIASGEGVIDRVVFMGMGEPMENLSEVVPAIEFLKGKHGYGLSRKKITVSTVGLCPEIAAFASSGVDVNLALSLHATQDTVRSRLVPVNRKYPIEMVLGATAEYGRSANARITIEYVLLDQVNDSDEDAKRLAKFSRRYEMPINIIQYNQIDSSEFNPSRRLDDFARMIKEERAPVTVRRSKGQNIAAACGQLAAKVGPTA